MTEPRTNPEPDATEFAPPEPPPHVQPVMPVAPKTRTTSGSSRLVNVVLGLAAAIAIGGTAFAAGRVTAPAAATAATGGQGSQRGNFPGGYFPGDRNFPGGGFGNGGQGGPNGNGLGGFRGLGGVIEGTIVSVDATSMTIRIGGANGGQGVEVRIPLASTTKVHQQAAASTSDLAAGTTVFVRLDTANGTPTPSTASSPAPAPSAGAVRSVQIPAADVTIVTR